jgi:CO/xanthine dehydrogenase Mo-binding subunit
MPEYKYIGKPADRVDALEKVLGTAKYIGDYHLPDMLYARALRSDIPHGNIKVLDTNLALAVQGVRAVITCEDLVGHGHYGFPVKDSYIIAYQKVRFAGEAIAVIAAETSEATEQGIRSIKCEIEPLPGVFNMDTALNPEAPQVGPGRTDGKPVNFLDMSPVYKGDPDEVMKVCDVRIDRHYSTPQQEHAYIETEGALAIPTPEGGVIVYSSSQSPFVNKGILVLTLGIDEELVRVIQPHVGGSFGGKDDLIYQTSVQVASLALKSKRPVRMTFSREESMLASYKRDAMHMHIQLGADKEGLLKVCKANHTLDSGAYSSQSLFTGWRASIHAMGAYRYDAVSVEVTSVYTNNGYSGAFRGFGNTEACFGIEQAIDEMADELNLDPIDFRLKNCLRVGDETPHGQVLKESVGLSDCLVTVRKLSNWDKLRKEYKNQTSSEIRKGIGVAALFHGTSIGAEGTDCATSKVEISPDNKIILTSGLTDYGQGSRTIYTLIAAEELGIDPNRIEILRPDTKTAIDSGPTVASRSTILGGNAIKIAARNLAKTINLSAADLLKCDVKQVYRIGETFIGPNEEPLPWEKVIEHARENGIILSYHGKWSAPSVHWNHKEGKGEPYFGYHFAAHIAEVEVDLRIGKAQVINFFAAHDTGTILFPQGALGQVCGGIAQGLGYALLEEALYDEGYLQSVNFDTYLIPTSLDVPEICVNFIETPFSPGPFGAKNIAEPSMVPAAPAILNAISNATGRRIRDLPADMEKITLGKTLHKNGSSISCKAGLKIR